MVPTRPWRDPVTDQVVQVPRGIDPGWQHNHGEGWLRGVVPQELREDLRPLASAATSQAPAALPPLPAARSAGAARVLPEGLTDEEYATAFLQPLGATLDQPRVIRDTTGARLVVGRALFEDGKGRLKIRAGGGEALQQGAHRRVAGHEGLQAALLVAGGANAVIFKERDHAVVEGMREGKRITL